MIKMEVNGSKVKTEFNGRDKEILLEALKLEWTLRKTLKENNLEVYIMFLGIVNATDFMDSMKKRGSKRKNSESEKKYFEDLLKQMMEGLDEEA